MGKTTTGWPKRSITCMKRTVWVSLPAGNGVRRGRRVSADHFTARFRSAFGITPRRFVSRERIRRAKELLLATPLNIQEIAFRCGFQDPYYFSRAFKKSEEMSPKAFRERYAPAEGV